MKSTRTTLSVTPLQRSYPLGRSYAELKFSNGLVLAASVMEVSGIRMAAVKAFCEEDFDTKPEALECFLLEGGRTASDVLNSPSMEAALRWTGYLNQVCIASKRKWVNREDVFQAICI